MFKNYYDILGISTNATQKEIKKAFKAQAKKYHPDINPDPNAEAMMKTVSEAYEVLSTLSSRQQYDAKLRQENKTMGNSQQSKTQYFHYNFYTKTRKERKIDSEDYLKDYLLDIDRELDSLKNNIEIPNYDEYFGNIDKYFDNLSKIKKRK